MNLISALNDNLSTATINRVAELTKETPDKIKAALESLNSIFVAGFMKRSSNDTGAQLLFKLIEKGNFDGSLVEKLNGSIKTNEQFMAVVATGSGMVSQLLPDKKSPIASLIGQHHKIRNSSAFNLLGLSAALIMHTLGKVVTDKKLDAAGLALWLSEQKDSLIEATPTPFLDKMIGMLGISNFMNLGYVQAEENPEPTSTAKKHESKPFLEPPDLSDGSPIKIPTSWIIAGVVAILVILGAIYAWRNWGVDSGTIPSDSTAQATPVEMVPDSATTPKTDTTKTEAPATTGTTLPNGERLSVPAGSFQQEMATYLADTAGVIGKKFIFDKLNFVPNSLTLTPESETEVNELVKVMKAYPNAQIKLTGYVGASADSLKSKSISFKRANAVKLSLMAKGIDVMRLDAVGGGRSTNRIDIKVVKR
ncbi:MAG: OmpA family protein [Spirosomataceae bacterium]